MRRRRRRRATGRFFIVLAILLVLIAAAVLLVSSCAKDPDGGDDGGGFLDFLGGGARATPELTPDLTPTPTPIPTPAAISGTRAEDFGIEPGLNLNGSDISTFRREKSFSFLEGSAYTNVEGIITFRGDHWRQNAAYGSADIQKKTLTEVWTADTASLPKGYGSGSWTGNGWTGQPLIVRWPESTRRVMNLNDEKKQKDGLVEVIYASMDGMIHFLDLDDGKATRAKIDIGVPFKGAGSLDPRGYPMIYLGAGDSTPAHHGRQEMVQEYFIYSLINGEKLYSFGKNPDPYAPREWHAYDSAALVDAGTDTLIEPGENGILYTMKLNSKFDPGAGTMTIKPTDMLKFRYTTARSRKGGADSYWLGMEASAAMWHRWLYVSDNAGTMLCIDTDTMEVVWAQDTLDDSNSSPVLEEEDGHPYLYTSTSLHWTQDSNKKGTIPVWKLDGLTGEILWQVNFECHTVDGVSGGVEGSGLLGKNDISNLIIYPIARTPDAGSGVLVALDKHTGKAAWTYNMQYYAWSSPVAVYDKSGKGYIIICDSQGNMTLLDGKTGDLLDQIKLNGNIEASPAVFDDMIVVGTRQQKIYGIQIG